MTLEELKIRQLTNQYLIRKAPKLTVIRDLNGFQAQFMSNALHSMKIRCSDFSPERAADALVKNWTVRGTVHVFAESDLALFMHCNDGVDYLRNEWRGYTYEGQSDRWALTPERQKFFADVIMDALSDGARTREELKKICRQKGMSEPEESSMFDKWGGGIREMCERGFLNYVVQEKKAFCRAPSFTPMAKQEAETELVRRYFTNFAPATVKDASYYFGMPQTKIKAILADLPVKTAECNGKTYFYIENGKSYDFDIPKCLFLAGFDQLMLGYQKAESIYLASEYLRGIFNLAGIVMPAVLLRGNVVGKWKKKNAKVEVTLFASLGEADRKIISRSARELWDDLSTIEFV